MTYLLCPKLFIRMSTPSCKLWRDSHLKHLRVYGSKLYGHPDFLREKTTAKLSLSFFQLNLNVYTDMVNRERVRVRDKKNTKGDKFSFYCVRTLILDLIVISLRTRSTGVY